MVVGAQEECIFCSIERTQPELVVYSTPNVIAFFDINPLILSEAHLLLVPRQHYQKLTDMPASDAAALGAALPVISRILLEETESTDFNVVQNNGPRAGQVVNHVHFHIVIRGKGIGGTPDNVVPAIVQRLRQQFTLRERLAIAGTVFGKGERTDLGNVEGFATKLRTRLAKI